jgi:ligand-binding SRPBCC domain-containing protein
LRITSETPSEMYEGMIITYRVTPFMSVPVNWVTEITHINKPYLFIYEQRLGPYRFWQHQHHFREIKEGVEIRDLVHYSLFLSPLDGLINMFVVRKRLREIFTYRRRYLENRFGRMKARSNKEKIPGLPH